MALDVFMQGYSFVRRNFFGIWGFVYSVPCFFMDELERQEQEEGRPVVFLEIRLFSLFFYHAFCVSSYYFLYPQPRDVLQLANWSGNGRGFWRLYVRSRGR